jgi:hypothetical protein
LRSDYANVFRGGIRAKDVECDPLLFNSSLVLAITAITAQIGFFRAVLKCVNF